MGHDGLEVYVGKITPLHMAGAFHFCFINFSAVPMYSLPLVELFAVFCPLPNCLSSSSKILEISSPSSPSSVKAHL